MNGGRGIKCETALRCMSLDLTEDKSTLVQVMAWCRQATSHYLSQCWPRSLPPYGVTRPRWVKKTLATFVKLKFCVNSQWSSDTIGRHRIDRSLVRVMAPVIFDTKPLHKPKPVYNQLGSKEHIEKSESKYRHFLLDIMHVDVSSIRWLFFVSASLC